MASGIALIRQDREPEDKSNPTQVTIGLIQFSSDQSRPLFLLILPCFLSGKVRDRCEHNCEPDDVVTNTCAPIGPFGLYRLVVVVQNKILLEVTVDWIVLIPEMSRLLYFPALHTLSCTATRVFKNCGDFMKKPARVPDNVGVITAVPRTHAGPCGLFKMYSGFLLSNLRWIGKLHLAKFQNRHPFISLPLSLSSFTLTIPRAVGEHH